MSFNVRLFGYSGIIQVGQPNADQYSGGAVFLNEEPCLWSQLLVCDGSTVATSAAITTVPDGTQMACVEVPDGHEIRYEVVQPGVAARAVGSNSRRGSGSFNLAWNPGYTLSIIDAAVAVAPPVAIPVLNAPSIIRPPGLLRPPRPPQPYNSALYASDPFFSKVVLLMDFEGANGDTGAPGMNDESSAAHGTATMPLGAGPTISSTYAKFGSTSLSVTGGKVISFPDSDDWAFGSGNYTVECSIKPTSIAGANMFLIGTWGIAPGVSWVMYLAATTGRLSMIASADGSTTPYNISGTTNVIANSTHTCAVDYDGTTTRVYLDGVMEAFTTTTVNIFNGSKDLGIGNAAGSSLGPYTGFLDAIRITKGAARYARDGGYVPATAAFPRS